MTTLKQLLKEHDLFLDNTDIDWSIEAVKEWLTQKRIEKKQAYTDRGFIHWNNVIDELLEELK
jgi:hypothetical protein